MKKILTIIFASVALVSCVDTEILPEDKTVEEDFWQTKSDVEMMVNGAYESFSSADNMKRIIVWSSRSDELTLNSSLHNSDLNQIQSGTTQTTNGYLSWGGFYTAINNCNLIISKSDEVRNIDPNYLEGDHNNNVGQMKALRALAYFYLIRAFRDVPLILEPYKMSSQEMNIPQSSGAVVLDQIIADLEEAKGMVLASESMTSWERCGKISRNGVYAMLADAYLWRASITGSEADYQKCIDCCDFIRDHRMEASITDADVNKDDKYNLNTVTNYYNVFAEQPSNPEMNNDGEILLELLFRDNSALCEMYNQNKYASNSQPPIFYTNSIYGLSKAGDENSVFNQTNSAKDVRGFESIYDFNKESDDGVRIRKYVAKRGLSFGLNQDPTSQIYDEPYKHSNNNTGYTTRPWVVYRVTDIMLMKAEALVQKARLIALSSETQNLMNDVQGNQTALLQKMEQIAALNVTAMRQVQIVNTRSRVDNASDVDSTKYAYANIPDIADPVKAITAYLGAKEYTSYSDNLETMVLEERARELCFEGRRWFDLLRYNYRHVSGVNYGAVLADMGANQSPIYDKMKKLMGRKPGAKAVVAKYVSEPWLYFPVQQSEIELNSTLKQNPVYFANETSSKNI